LVVITIIALAAIAQAQIFSRGKRKNSEEPHLSQRLDPQYFLRMHSMLNAPGRLERSCVLVRLDHSFRLERTLQETGDRKPRTQMIAEGNLTSQQAEQLDGLLKDPDVASSLPVRVPTRVIFFRSNARFIAAEIPRTKYRTQTFNGVAMEGQPVDPGMKLLVTFIESVEASELSPSSGATLTGCAPPKAKAPLK
jgi:hypothetical protein